MSQLSEHDLISLVTHELRSPLTAIRGYLSMLTTTDADNLTDQQRLFLSRMDRSSQRMADLIDKLLNINYIESGKMVLTAIPVSPEQIISEVVADLSSGICAYNARVEIVRHRRQPMVLADPVKLRQIATNIIDNAVKYSPDGGVVTVSFRRRGDELIITVTDTGVGIPKEQFDKLFEKFGRLCHPATADRPGSGLGLYIVKRLVESHGGRVWLSSREGRGTKFNFTLPIANQLHLID